jgi:RNA polymerase sigma-70 factor (ECF subfamily)
MRSVSLVPAAHSYLFIFLRNILCFWTLCVGDPQKSSSNDGELRQLCLHTFVEDTVAHDCVLFTNRNAASARVLAGEGAMSPRISRLVFGAPAHPDVDFVSACVPDLSASPTAPDISLLNHLRQKFLSDEELAGQLQSGNADALTWLFKRHSSRLFGIAQRILRNDAEAEDVVQQIFLDVFRSIHQFDSDKGEFKTWLLMFAYQRTFNRRRHLFANRFFLTDPFDEVQEYLSHSTNIDAGIFMEQVLSNLQPRQRRTIELVYYEGLTAEEVSAHTGETVRVVRHNLYRGLEKLRKLFAANYSSECGLSKGGKR